jgi:hypothetical protein
MSDLDNLGEKNMKRRERKLYDSDADECRKRGFKVGNYLSADEGFGETVILLTAIGERSILAREISHKGKPVPYSDDVSWTLSCRDWNLLK